MSSFSNEGDKYATSWTVKEAVLILLIYFFFGILINLALSALLPRMSMPANFLASVLLVLPSLSLVAICLIWLSLLKRGSLKAIGVNECRLRYFPYAVICAVGLYLVPRVLCEPSLVDKLVPSFKEGYTLWRGLNVVLLIPIAEEIYFRGVLFTACRAKFGLPVGVIISAVLFGLVHFNPHYPSLWYLSVGPPIPSGLVFALLFHYSGSLLPAILCHWILNLLSILA